MLKEFKFEALNQFADGALARCVDQEIARCVQDMHDRPGLTTARKIKIELLLAPVMGMERDATLEQVKHGFSVTCALPKRESRVFTLGVKQSGHLYYSEESPDNPDQLGLAFTPDEA